MSLDLLSEGFVLVVVAALALGLAVALRRRATGVAGAPGVREILAGATLFVVGAAVDLADELVPGLDGSWLEALGEELTYAVGFVLLALGLTRWMRETGGWGEAWRALRVLADRIGAVFWVASPDRGRLHYLSAGFERVWGRPRQPFIADPRLLLGTVHPADRARLRVAIAEHARVHMPALVEERFRILRPDGEERTLQARYVPLHDRDGRVSRVVGVVEDVTEREAEAARRIAEAARQRETLVREVHHRIKNHLQGLVGLLRAAARERPECAPALVAAAGRVHAIAVVHGLQSVSGEAEVAVGELVRAICRGAELTTGATVAPHVDVDVRGAVCLAPAEVVPVALVLQELLVNAVKHGEDAEPVRVTVGGDATEVQVRVENRGRLPRGFDLERGAGTGVGLGLVRSLLAPDGASLQVRERDGRVRAELVLRPPVLVES